MEGLGLTPLALARSPDEREEGTDAILHGKTATTTIVFLCGKENWLP
jgi:hypothetical protein